MTNKIKWTLQRMFRKSKMSDIDLWDLNTHIAKDIYHKLVAFKKALKTYPHEQYNSIEAWKLDVSKMIMAFDFFSIKRYETIELNKFCKKYKLEEYNFDIYNKQDHDMIYKEMQKNLQLFSRKFSDLWY